MAKKQTRRSISVSRTTYERLKAFCEANNVSMSQLVETRVNDFLGNEGTTSVVPTQPRPTLPASRPQGAGADDLRGRQVRGGSAAAHHQAQAGDHGTQARREAPRPDLHL